MRTRYIVLAAAASAAAGLAVFLAPAFNQPREKSSVANTSPEYLEKRQTEREYLQEGEALVAQGKGAEAEAAFRKAQELLPDSRNLDAEAGLAEALFAQGKRQEALQTYQRIFEAAPGSIRLLLRYGKLCDRAGEHQEAMSAYRRAFELQGTDSGFPVQLSQNPSDAEIREKAEAALRTYQQGAPDWQVKRERELAGK